MKLIKIYPIILFFLLSACTWDNEGFQIGHGNIISVDGPQTGNVNENIPFEVNFVAGACGQFEKLIEHVKGHDISISAVVLYPNNACIDTGKDFQTLYTFKASNPGTYFLKFESRPGEFLNKEIEIK